MLRQGVTDIKFLLTFSKSFFHRRMKLEGDSLREKCPDMEFFLFHIFLYSDQEKLRILTLFTQ